MAEWSAGYVTDLGYTHGFYRELTPSYLGLVPLAVGQTGFDANDALMICELGCGQGLSANLIAAANPHIQYYATDFNPAHIVGAKALAAEAGTANVHFFDNSFAEFLVEPSLPSFDVIMLHGIYSWVHAPQRAEIVEFIRRKLKPGGLVYISYNSLPGWSAAAPMRHLMYMFGNHLGGPTAGRLDPAFEFIGKMIEANAGYFRVNPPLKERFEKLKTQDRNYLAHEYLNEAWTLLYHSEVAAELQPAKVSFIGSAAFLEMVDVINLTTDQQAILAQFSDRTMRETVRDYIVNQQFRRDVFMRGTLPLKKAESHAKWLDKRFVLSIQRADVPLKTQGSQGEVTLKEEVYGPILDGFADGARTVKQLVADPKVAAIGWESLVQALIILVGAGHLQPCLDEKGDAKRSQRTAAFNKAVLSRSLVSNDLQYLASPLTGGGIQVDRFSQLFLLAQQTKGADPIEFVTKAMAANGERFLKDGKQIESSEENLAKLTELFEAYKNKMALSLRRLGIS